MTSPCYRRILQRILPAFLLILAGSSLLAQTYDWVRHSESSVAALTTAATAGVVSDKDGNVFVTGTFRGPAKFDTQTPANAGETDVYVAKYSPTGDFLWVRSGGGVDYDSAMAIALDQAGNIYVLGVFRQSANFDSKIETSQGGSDVLLLKYNTQGVLQWFIRIGGAANDRAQGLSIDGKGNIYISGTFEGGADFLGQTMTSAGQSDIFVLKMTLDHVLQWYKQAGEFGGRAEGLGIKHDGDGNAYVTGYFSNTMSFGADGQLIDAGMGDFFVAKYSSSGDELWAKRGGGLGADAGRAISTDQAANVYVVGTVDSASTFNGNEFPFAGEVDAFIAKYTKEGVLQWISPMTGTGYEVPRSIKTDQGGSSYVAGEFDGTVVFGSKGLTSTTDQDSTDIFIAKYSAGGEALWAFNTGGAWNDAANSVWVDKDVVLIGGYYSDEIFFGPEIPANKILGKFNEAFVARLQQPLSVSIGAVGSGPFCPGAVLNIPYTTSGEFGSSNTFAVALSDANGSFDAPEVIGQAFATTGGTIEATIPVNTPSGTGYRLRVVGTEPFTIGPDNGSDITITSTPTVAIETAGTTTICAGDSVELRAPAGFTTYLWSNNEVRQNIFVKEAGSYTVTASMGAGCTGTSEAVTIAMHPTPTKPTITQNGMSLESSQGVTYQWWTRGRAEGGDEMVGTERIFTPTSNGSYVVITTDANGCKSTSDPFQFSGTSVPTEAEARELSIYPHPTTGVFTIDLTLPAEQAVNVTVTNSIGQTVATQSSGASGTEYRSRIDIGELPAGLYFIEIESGGRTWKRQIIKR